VLDRIVLKSLNRKFQLHGIVRAGFSVTAGGGAATSNFEARTIPWPVPVSGNENDTYMELTLEHRLTCWVDNPDVLTYHGVSRGYCYARIGQPFITVGEVGRNGRENGKTSISFARKRIWQWPTLCKGAPKLPSGWPTVLRSFQYRFNRITSGSICLGMAPGCQEYRVVSGKNMATPTWAGWMRYLPATNMGAFTSIASLRG